MEDIVEGMRKDIEVAMLPKGDTFRVSFTYEDRRLVARRREQAGREFIDESNQDRTTFA